MTIKSGTKLRLALDVPVGQMPDFNMICTFARSVDEATFLVSVPMKDGKPLTIDENQKILIRYSDSNNDNGMIVAGFVDDIVREGIRRYWKVHRVSEHRQFFKRADERVKVAVPISFMQDTWKPNSDGIIENEQGMSLDISAGGVALFLNRRFEVGEICEMTMPRIGSSEEGREISGVIAVVCWMREAPKGSIYHNICGFQFRFAEPSEKERMQNYVANLKKKYKL